MTRNLQNAADYASLAESRLVELARAGDRDAFGAIMQRCNQRLFRVARSVVGDDTEAEDVLQAAYLRAFAAIGGFRSEASLLTWLTRITLNEARMRLRRRRPVAPVEAIEAAQAGGGEVIMFPGAPMSPEAEAARSEARRLMETAIDDLPEAFRLVFILREIEQCTVEETANQLSLRAETVKTRLFRARKLLKQALEDRLASSVREAFPFLGARCERIAARVLARMPAIPS